MPRQRRWLVVQSFEWRPSRNAVMVFRAGDVRKGLTRACILHAGARIIEIRD